MQRPNGWLSIFSQLLFPICGSFSHLALGSGNFSRSCVEFFLPWLDSFKFFLIFLLDNTNEPRTALVDIYFWLTSASLFESSTFTNLSRNQPVLLPTGLVFHLLEVGRTAIGVPFTQKNTGNMFQLSNLN